jgi:uncharacterized protein (DUF488 family)
MTFEHSASLPHPFYTVGHSNRTIELFVELIQDADIEIVIDVRTVPRSRAQPQFNAEALARKLAEANRRYEHFSVLGGFRKVSGNIPPEVNGLWQNQSVHNYADYALGDEFRSGLARLLETGQECICAIMCAEAVWWRCHRRIIADYLIAAGETVMHILGPGRIELAELTHGAKMHSGGGVTYPLAANI